VLLTYYMSLRSNLSRDASHFVMPDAKTQMARTTSHRATRAPQINVVSTLAATWDNCPSPGQNLRDAAGGKK